MIKSVSINDQILYNQYFNCIRYSLKVILSTDFSTIHIVNHSLAYKNVLQYLKKY